MAIDMIERTNEGAHATSRLGDFQFADDSKHFKNFTGGQDFFQGQGEDWANLFGSKLAKKNLATANKEGQDFVAKLPAIVKKNPSCDDISKSLDLLSVFIEAQIKEIAQMKGGVVRYPQARLAVARKAEGELKIKQTQLDCIALQEKAKADEAKAETINTLTTLSESSIQNAKNDLLGVNQDLANQGGSSSNIGGAISGNKNLLLYGGLGLGAILLILLLRRK